ncbi:hypothetical protein [Methylobrevis pamukkalensis]|uniref:Uncharacterized protein n=1 Tax=Methylobrevis pamukkalensis TaxID=1439726 RepID=A0A1E3H0Q6_9HYPH|nr:hypothetical protein [Methylobrevis pamukkalensis]ODN69899.1 hypothetical protein A6302_02781 [Methylobrevis pamukkalensis]
MSLTTSYLVTPIRRGRRNALTPGETRRASTEAEARRIADGMMLRAVGAFVIAQDEDVQAQIYGEPRLVATLGEVPEITF